MFKEKLSGDTTDGMDLIGEDLPKLLSMTKKTDIGMKVSTIFNSIKKITHYVINLYESNVFVWTGLNWRISIWNAWTIIQFKNNYISGVPHILYQNNRNTLFDFVSFPRKIIIFIVLNSSLDKTFLFFEKSTAKVQILVTERMDSKTTQIYTKWISIISQKFRNVTHQKHFLGFFNLHYYKLVLYGKLNFSEKVFKE